MKTKLSIMTAVVVCLLMAITACQAKPTLPPTPDMDATLAVNVAVAQTAAVLQTQAAQTISAFEALHPSETPTPTVTATPVYSPTPDKVTVTVNKDTYCRVGTSSLFKSVFYAEAGTVLEVIARNPTNDSYYVVNPNQSFSFCWLYGEFTTISGNAEALPIYTSIPLPTNTPTPTPAPDFSVEYVGMSSCGTNYYLRFQVRNPSKFTWQAVQVDVTDKTTSISTSTFSSAFTDYAGCSAGVSQSDLSPSEDGIATSFNAPFTTDPTGHSLSATIMVCQTDSGGCMSKTISFTP